MGKTQSSPHAPVIRTSDPIIPSESRLSKEIHTDGVPIEELALASIFPDLNIANRMQIDKLDCQHEHSHLHQDYIKDPLPVVAVKLTKTVPTPSYQLLKNTNQKKRPLSKAEDFPPFSKFIEATENELAERVEYDMDEQDRQWLTLLNTKIKKLGEKECSYDCFEFVMDQLEKEWFNLIKDIPKLLQEETHFNDDITCAVCDDGEAENSNAIVFCDGCNLAVHQDCYGVPFIPEGQWLCRKCMLSPENPVSCILCPNEGGAYKQTSANKWAHLICSIWIPECHISNTVFMEPIEGIEEIQKSRWKLVCYICQKRHGAPIQCANRHCFVAFHVTCARKARLQMKMRGHDITDSSQFKAYCEKHLSKDYRDQVDVDHYLLEAQNEFSKVASATAPTPAQLDQRKQKNKKRSAQSLSKDTFSIYSPIIPSIILKSLTSSSSELLPKKKNDLIINIAKYWALKKESRRGATLLKRLHLEPWTANASASKEEDEMKVQKYEVLSVVRKDLEKARLLIDLVRRRERQKLKYYRMLNSFFEYAVFPLSHLLKPILQKCKSIDKYEFFARPVDEGQVPDYSTIIKNPMDFEKMTATLENQEYESLQQFTDDINLICGNCILYNKPDTVYVKAAIRLRSYYEAVLPSLKERLDVLGIDERGYWKKGSSVFDRLKDGFAEN